MFFMKTLPTNHWKIGRAQSRGPKSGGRQEGERTSTSWRESYGNF
jgi:hypothetical protein